MDGRVLRVVPFKGETVMGTTVEVGKQVRVTCSIVSRGLRTFRQATLKSEGERCMVF